MTKFSSSCLINVEQFPLPVWLYYCCDFSGDLAYFDSLKETIIAVGLVKPKPGEHKIRI